MTKPRLLDMYCGAGGAARGYQNAGFYVVGVDIKPQPNYCGDDFIQGDALEFFDELGWGYLAKYAAIHASPPCQAYSTVSGRALKGHRREYPDLVAPTRQRLEECGLPFVIENVIGSPLRNPITLCGSMFGLDVRRHRLFESNVLLLSQSCQHERQTPRFRSPDSRRDFALAGVVGVHGHLNYPGEGELRKQAMGIDWMNQRELTQAIPPAYTEYIGKQLMAVLS